MRRAVGFVLRLAVVLAVALVLATAALADPGERPHPNIILITADDLGWADLGCYGSDLHETPRLDRLAGEGVRFSAAYAASPVCTPTRASVLTGRYPARLGMTIWREAARDRGDRRLLEPVCLDSLPLEETTLAEVLGGAGYYCAHIGKWHLGRAEAYPEPHGFDVNVGGTLWGAPQSFFYPYRGDRYFRGWRYVPGLEPGEPGDYLTDALTDRAIEVLRRESGRGRPVFLNLSYYAVHTPVEGPPDLVEKYRAKLDDEDRELRHRNPQYAAMVEALDRNVGRLLDEIDRLGVAGETVVVFTSDNGGFINPCKLNPGVPVTDNHPLRSGKGSCYEGGLRVPLIVRAPGAAAAAGRNCREPVISCDLFPTILGLAGIAQPAGSPAVDGRDIGGLITENPAPPLGREALFFHYPHYYLTTEPVSAVRSGRWKLVEFLGDGGTVELYDLESDPGESQDLAAAEPERRDGLLARLEAWRREVGAAMPEPNPSHSTGRGR